MQSAGSQLVAGHVDRPLCPFDRVGPHDRGTPTAHKRVGGPGPRAYATGALFVPLEHPKLLGLGHGSSSLRVTAGTGTPREGGTAR